MWFCKMNVTMRKCRFKILITYSCRKNVWCQVFTLIVSFSDLIYRKYNFGILTTYFLNVWNVSFMLFYRASFASWLLMNLLIVVVPRYGAYQMIITGGLMLTTNLIYYLLIPTKPLVIRFEDKFLMFKFGWSFWLVLVAGK